jgi:hypothetical protein
VASAPPIPASELEALIVAEERAFRRAFDGEFVR